MTSFSRDRSWVYPCIMAEGHGSSGVNLPAKENTPTQESSRHAYIKPVGIYQHRNYI